jgi:hypothetical protein
MTIEATFTDGNKVNIELSGSIEFINEFAKPLQKVIGFNDGSISKMTPNEDLEDFLSSSILVEMQRQLDAKNEQDLNTLENQSLEL